MAVPDATTAISLAKIRNEFEQNNYNHSLYGYTAGETSLASLSNGTYGTINTENAASDRPDGSPPHAMSEFFSYDHDKTAPVFNWTGPSGSIIYASTGMFDVSDTDDANNPVYAGTEIQIVWGTGGTHTVGIRDWRNASTPTGTGAVRTPSSGFTSLTNITSSNTPTSLQARWIVVDGDFTMDGTTGDDDVKAAYLPGGSLSTTTQTVRGGAQTNVTNHDYNGAYVDIKPAAFSGSGSNTQLFRFFAEADGAGASAGQATISTNASGDYVALQIRANGDNSKVITIRSPNITNSVDISALSFEAPDFSCLLPTMQVRHETKGLIPISSVVVGDNIETVADLNNISGSKIYTRVTENTIHNRSGYWNVENGLKITNDHPVWLSDESSSAWVKVEDMRPHINRTYHAGAVDTHYVATEAGHFYAYYENVTFDNPGYRWIVSGNYSPETD